MSRLARRGRVRRTLISTIAAMGLVMGIIPTVGATPAATNWTVDRTEVVVGAARLFTFTYSGGSGSTVFTVPSAFSAPAGGAADKSSGTIAGVGWIATTGGVAISSYSGSTISLTLTGAGTLKYFGRTNATGRNEFKIGTKPARAVPVWGRPAKISVAVSPTKRVASTTGTMAATALVTDVNGAVQDKVVLYFRTSLPSGTTFTAEADGVAGCSGSSVDGIVCTGADGKAGVTFKTGTTAGCYQATAQNRAWPQSYNGSGSFQVWPDTWVRDRDHVSVKASFSYLGWNVSKDVKVYGFDKWGNRANITSGDAAYLTKIGGTGSVRASDLTSGSATYRAGSCWGAPAVFDVKGKTLGTVTLRGWLRGISSGDSVTFRVVPGVATKVEVKVYDDGSTMTFVDTTTYQYVKVKAWDGDGNRICDLEDALHATSARDTHVSATTSITGKLSIGAATYPSDDCGDGYSGDSPVAKVAVRALTDGTSATFYLRGYVNGVSSYDTGDAGKKQVTAIIQGPIAMIGTWLADTSRSAVAVAWTGAVTIARAILGA